MTLDYWLPESLLTDDFNSLGRILLNSKENRINSVNNLEFLILLIAHSDVFDREVELYLQFRIIELIERKITQLRYECGKSIFSFLLKHSLKLFNTHFDQLINYLNR